MFPGVGRREAEQDGEDEVFPGVGRWEVEQDGDEVFPGVALQEGHILKQILVMMQLYSLYLFFKLINKPDNLCPFLECTEHLFGLQFPHLGSGCLL